MNCRFYLAVVVVLAVVEESPWVRAADSVRYEPRWESLDRRPTPQWFLDAKFGVFIHWGVYSVPAWGRRRRTPSGTGTTWPTTSRTTSGGSSTRRTTARSSTYQEFAPLFKAELFDAGQWADIFARSGAKYVVLTSKHHDGFALWPSAEASRTWGRPWNSVEVGPHRDLLGDLADAVAQAGHEDGLLLLALRVVQPALAQGPQALRRSST